MDTVNKKINGPDLDRLCKFIEEVVETMQPVSPSEKINGGAKGRLADVHEEGAWMFTRKAVKLATEITEESITNLQQRPKSDGNPINVYIFIAEVIVFVREYIRENHHLEEYYQEKRECVPYTRATNSKLDALLDMNCEANMKAEFQGMLKRSVKLMANPTETNWRDPFSVVAHFKKHGSILSTLKEFFSLSQAISKMRNTSSADSSKNALHYANHKIVFSNGNVQYIKTLFNPDAHDEKHICKKCLRNIELLQLQATLKCLSVVMFLEKCRKSNIQPVLTSFVKYDDFDIPKMSFAKLIYHWKRQILKRCCITELDEFSNCDKNVKDYMEAMFENEEKTKMFGSIVYKPLPYVQLGPYVLFICKESPPDISEACSIRCERTDNILSVEFLSRHFSSDYSQVYIPLEDVVRSQTLMKENRRAMIEEFLHFGIETMVWTKDKCKHFQDTLERLLTKSNEEADKCTLNTTDVLLKWAEDEMPVKQLRVDPPESMETDCSPPNTQSESNERKRKLDAEKESESIATQFNEAYMNNVEIAKNRAKIFLKRGQIQTYLMVCKVGQMLKPTAEQSEEMQFSQDDANSNTEPSLIKPIQNILSWDAPRQPGGALRAELEFDGTHLAVILTRSRDNLVLKQRLLPDRLGFCQCGGCSLVSRTTQCAEFFTDYCCQEALWGSNVEENGLAQYFPDIMHEHSGCVTEVADFRKHLSQFIETRSTDLSGIMGNSLKFTYGLSCNLSNVALFKEKGCVEWYKDTHLPSCVVAALQKWMKYDGATPPNEFTFRYKHNQNPDFVGIFNTVWHPTDVELSYPTSLLEALKDAVHEDKFRSLASNVTDEWKLLALVPSKCKVNVFVYVTYAQQFLAYTWKAFHSVKCRKGENKDRSEWDFIAEKLEDQRAIFLKRNENRQYQVISWNRKDCNPVA